MEKFLTILSIFTSLLPVIAFIWWIIKSVFNHDERIKANEDDIKEFKELKVGDNLRDHGFRIGLLENAYNTIIKNTNQLITDTAEIKGLLQSKKDKE